MSTNTVADVVGGTKPAGLGGHFFFMVLAMASYLILGRWLNQDCYRLFLNAWQTESPLVSQIVAGIYATCALCLFLPWWSSQFPRLLVAMSLFLCITAAGIVLGLQGSEGLGEFAAVLFGGFLGALFGGLTAFLLRWDESDSSRLVICVWCAVIGMFAFTGTLGYLDETFPELFAFIKPFIGLTTLAFGGVVGFVIAHIVTTRMEGEKSDRAFKYLLCCMLAGLAARVVYVSLQHGLSK